MGTTTLVRSILCIAIVTACFGCGATSTADLSSLPYQHRAPSPPPPLDDGHIVLPLDWLELPTVAVLPEGGPRTLAITPDLRFELSPNRGVIAIDRETRATRWEHDDPRTRGSRIVATACGRFFRARGDTLLAVDAATGRPAWSRTFPGEYVFELWTRGCRLIVQSASRSDGPGLFVLDTATGREQLATRCYFDCRPTEITDEGVRFRTVEGERHFDWNRGELSDLPFRRGTTVESIAGTTALVIEHGRRLAAIDLVDHQLRWARDLDVDPEQWHSIFRLARVDADLVLLEGDELVRRSIEDGSVRWRRALSDEIAEGLRRGDATVVGELLVLSLATPPVLLGIDIDDGSFLWARRLTNSGHVERAGDRWVWAGHALIDARVEAPAIRERLPRSRQVERCVVVLGSRTSESTQWWDAPATRRDCLSWLTRVGTEVRAELSALLVTSEVRLAADLLVAFDGDLLAATRVLARTYGPPTRESVLARTRSCRHVRGALSEDDARWLSDQSAEWLAWVVLGRDQQPGDLWLREQVGESVRECHDALLRSAPSGASVRAFRDRVRALARATLDAACMPTEDEAVAAEAIRGMTELDRDPLRRIVADEGACLSVQTLAGGLPVVVSTNRREPSIRVTRIREAGVSEGATASDRVVTIVEMDRHHPLGEGRDVLVRRVGDAWHASPPPSGIDWH
ncbi:MAG: PQQ-binding-like beta-propeller repeat protein [Deltaproteobacteria bacterium]|nr:PQQ-binding-like beta-propeller repeat protein [Deltaproteobacteria bacterium]